MKILRCLSAIFMLPAVTFAAFDCTKIDAGNDKIVDISSLFPSDVSVVATLKLSPATQVSNITLNLCRRLSFPESSPTSKVCGDGTRVCGQVFSFVKEDKSDTRLEHEINMGKGDPTLVSASSDGVKLVFVGEKRVDNNQATPFETTIVFKCNKDKTNPKFSLSGDLLTILPPGLLNITLTWETSAACIQSSDESDDGNSMSGFGIFMLIIFVAFASYFVLGSAFRYVVLKSRGVEIVPHYDFWHSCCCGCGESIGGLFGWVREKITGQPRYYSPMLT